MNDKEMVKYLVLVAKHEHADVIALNTNNRVDGIFSLYSAGQEVSARKDFESIRLAPGASCFLLNMVTHKTIARRFSCSSIVHEVK